MQLEEINKKERDKWSYKLAEIIKYKPNDILLLKCPECSYKTENKVFYKPRDLIKVWEYRHRSDSISPKIVQRNIRYKNQNL